MPRAQDLLAAVERGATYAALRRKEHQTGTGHDDIVDNIEHAALIGTDDKLLQRDMVSIFKDIK